MQQQQRTLNLHTLTGPTVSYSLRAVLRHRYTGSRTQWQGGHYITWAKHQISDLWYSYDDLNVEQLNKTPLPSHLLCTDDIHWGAPYALCYIRDDI